jgi:hypothetical protein
MSIVFPGAYNPLDWRAVVVRGAVLKCEGGRRERNILLPALCFEAATVPAAGELPAGWVIVREFYPEGCILSFYCPECDPVYG